MESDFELLDRWCAGDKQAGQALLGRHFDTLCGFFETKVDRDPEDLVQRTLLACTASKEQFRKESSFRTYLFTVARHELYRYLRTKQRDGDRLDFSITSIAEILTTPGTRMVRDEAKRQVREALCQLPLDDQTMLELHYYQDVGIDELCRVFDLEPGTVRVRLHRARKKLRELLGLHEEGDELELLASRAAPGPRNHGGTDKSHRRT